MKALRRRRILGSRTPWEQLSGAGFTGDERGFVLVVDREGRLVTASRSWTDWTRDRWLWPEGGHWQDVPPRPGHERSWLQWTRLVRRALDSDGPFQAAVRFNGIGDAPARIEYLSQPVRDVDGRTVGKIIAGKFRPGGRQTLESAEPSDVARHSADRVACLWIRAKRRRGESGWVVENASADAARLVAGAEVGADFPACLPAAFRRRCRLVLETARDRAPAENIHTFEPNFPPDAPPLELTLLPLGAERWCVLLREDRSRAAMRRMLLAGSEQIVSTEGELRRAQRLATQGMLAAAIGHEVNNCLGIALANASLFRERHGHEDEAASAVDPIIYAVQTAGRICQRFRNLGSRGETKPDVVDLAVVARRTFEMLMRIVGRHFTFESRAVGPLWVRADPTHLEQIVVNLVLNARDATTEKKGRIRLVVGGGPGAASDHAPHWIEVADNGAGIPAEIQRKLFTAYFTTKPHKRGTGLGLATVQRLTKELGGDVALQSEVGAGTTLRISLPAADEPLVNVVPPARPKSRAAAAQSSRRGTSGKVGVGDLAP
jgi:signal transduction histidine kinase